MLGIARNVARDQLRTRRRRPAVPLEGDVAADDAEAGPSEAVRNETKALVDAAVASLPPELREQQREYLDKLDRRGVDTDG